MQSIDYFNLPPSQLFSLEVSAGVVALSSMMATNSTLLALRVCARCVVVVYERVNFAQMHMSQGLWLSGLILFFQIMGPVQPTEVAGSNPASVIWPSLPEFVSVSYM